MKPDLSDEYVLDRAARTLNSGAAAVQSAVMRIDRRERRRPAALQGGADRLAEADTRDEVANPMVWLIEFSVSPDSADH
jgi:hypothetical protein